jgi:hypothetical protein
MKNLIKGLLNDYSIIRVVLSREGSSTYRLGQSVVVPGVWLSPPQGS